MEINMKKFECIHHGDDQLGEGPVWNDQDQSLYWLDCVGKKISATALDNSPVRTWSLPDMPGSYAFREHGGLVMAFRRGLAFVDLNESGVATEWIPNTGVDPKTVRFNDGACDRRGRFWAGTFHNKITEPLGGLYRLDGDRSVHNMDTGIMMSNGMAWSPDNRTMYYTDTRPGYVYAYDFDLDDGTVRNRRIFLDYSKEPYSADGCTVDAAGCLWVAEVDAGRIARYTPAGKRDAVYELPVSRPSSVAFAGANLDVLCVTTLRFGLSEEEKAREPLAGALFALSPGVSGLPEPRFRG